VHREYEYSSGSHGDGAHCSVAASEGKDVDFILCCYEAHAGAILDIFNEAIVNSTALYDYKPRARESMTGWFKAKDDGGFPVIGAVSPRGELVGFATYGTFRAWPAYKYSVEHSVYVHNDHRGQGIGAGLLRELIAAATQQQYHLMVGGVDVTNSASVALHEKLGFAHAGTIRQAAFKFGTWRDLSFYQLLLGTPAHPMDG
jgi:L-amino acid N-acyltransferase